MKRTYESNRKKKRKRYYVCNGKRCANCSRKTFEQCHYTADIEYALYDDHKAFVLAPDGSEWEVIRR